MYLAENLKYLRKEKKLSQNALANVLKVSDGAVAMWETQKREPDLETLIAIADYFEVNLEDLVRRKMKQPLPIHVINVGYLREKYEIKQVEMVALIGLKTESDYYKKEKGDVPFSFDEAIKIADFFGITLEQLAKTDLSKRRCLE